MKTAEFSFVTLFRLQVSAQWYVTATLLATVSVVAKGASIAICI